MASSMVVPVSKDTLFMRGFSSRHSVDDIREYFGRDEDNMPTVEFFKTSDDRTQLFVALRFDSKDRAKDVINRYNGTEILGDHVNMTWFKDLRRVRGNRYRMDMGNRYRRWSPPNRGDYWDRGDQYHYGGGRQWRGRSPSGGRQSRRYERSSSRSASRSRSRSASLSRSRSHDKAAANNRSHSSESHEDSKRTRSRRKRDSDRQPFSPRDRSSDNEPRERKRRKNKSEVDDGGEKKERRHKRKDASSSEDERDKTADVSTRRQSSGSDRGSSSDRSPAKVSKPLRSAVSTVETPAGKTAQDSRYDGADNKVEKTASKTSREDQSPGAPGTGEYSAYDGAQKSTQKQNRSVNRKRVDSLHSEDDEMADNPESPPFTKQPSDFNYRNNDRRMVDVEDMPLPSDDGRHKADPPIANQQRKRGGYGSDDGDAEEIEEGEVAECRPNVSLVDYDVKTSRRASLEKSISNSSKKRMDETLVHKDSKSDPLDATPTGVPPVAEVIRDTTTHKTSNGMFMKEMNKGALALPQDKMSIVREKKDDIEKAYRQDCETFAVVVKMLISKDEGLEEKLQKSLRENLKEIGQRCIQELREFIEEVKTDNAATTN